MKTVKNVCLIAGIVLAFSACKKNESASTTPLKSLQSENKIQLSSVGRLLFPSEVFKEEDPKSLKEKLVQLGMSKVDDKTYVQKFPVKGFTIVLSSGKVIEPNSERDLFLTEEDFKDMIKPFQLKVRGTLIPAKDYRYSPITREIIFESTIQDFLAKRAEMVGEADCHSKEGKGITTSATRKAMGRCMDYNGPLSDGGNYRITDWRSSRNYLGSDCYFAVGIGYCWFEHANPGCHAEHGGRSCSNIIGCPDTYHIHTRYRHYELSNMLPGSRWGS